MSYNDSNYRRMPHSLGESRHSDPNPRTEARFCIPCADYFWFGALCKHLWYCESGRCFMGGGDADYPCSDPKCSGCVERLKNWNVR